MTALAWPVPADAQWRSPEPSQGYGPEPRSFIDPLDGSHFEAGVLHSTNGLGGYDSDGCSYGKGLQPRAFAIATSPTTLFSAPIGDFPRVLSEAQRQQIGTALLAFGDPQQVARKSAAEGYEIAAAVARVLGKGHFRTGELYLSGAWTVRDTIVGFLPGLRGAGDTWRKMLDVSGRAQEQSSDRAKTRAMFDLARICQRGGFSAERETFLELLSTFSDAGLGAVEKREEFRRRVAHEQRLLQLAKGEFQAGLAAGEGTAEDQSYYLYLVGDIERRAGNFEAAEVALLRVEASKDAAAEVVAQASDILRVLAVQDRNEPGAEKPAGAGGSK
jgi:hypothetical protein